MKRVNVLQFICPTGFYGAERWVLALANNLNPEAVRSDLAVTKESEQQNLEIVNQFPEGEGKTFQLEMSGRFDWSVVTKLCAVIKDREIDIIHTHGYKSDILGLIAAKRSGIKCISTPHGFGEAKDFKLKAYIWVGCALLRFFDKVSPLSQQLVDEVIAAGVPRKKVHYIQNAVDLKEVDAYWEKRQESPHPEKRQVIGFVGQMIPRKKVTFILDIFNRLWQDNNALVLQLLGDGSERESLEAYAKGLPCAEAVEFLGFRKDRLDIMLQFDLFVMTSSSEGIPRCLMEAVAMEIPVAAFNIPGIDQLIEHEKTGLLAPYGDEETLTTHWLTLLNDKGYAKTLTTAGRQFILDHFSSRRMADEYLELFTDVLTQR